MESWKISHICAESAEQVHTEERLRQGESHIQINVGLISVYEDSLRFFDKYGGLSEDKSAGDADTFVSFMETAPEQEEKHDTNITSCQDVVYANEREVYINTINITCCGTRIRVSIHEQMIFALQRGVISKLCCQLRAKPNVEVSEDFSFPV